MLQCKQFAVCESVPALLANSQGGDLTWHSMLIGQSQAVLCCLGLPQAEYYANDGPIAYCWCRVDAGKVELDGAQYLGFRLPFTISQLCWIEAILVGGAEVYRNGELNSEKRIYPGEPALHMISHVHLPNGAQAFPSDCDVLAQQLCIWPAHQAISLPDVEPIVAGGYFDPLSLVDGQDEARTFRLKEAEIKHGRLAMVAFLGKPHIPHVANIYQGIEYPFFVA